MKKIAAILLIIFALVQAGPAVNVLIKNDKVSLFIVDEEKNNTAKEDFQKQIKKDISSVSTFNDSPFYCFGQYFTKKEDIRSCHAPDNLTPPPNC